MVIKVWELIKGTCLCLEYEFNSSTGMAALNLQNERIQIENKFLVPYQANSRFIGRTKFLQTLKEKLSDVAPNHDNHRVALHGMGGIGKTQCALGYVYANRDAYER